ncbi:PREDICTED: PI-PLC X domain-containing protein At5g67130 [Brassica oleracea var. oleracea]|uniref:Phosphatidylinositol-specific phospholipase C X domain-containing protein n=1 Tax=Brassica oleracea var. oleracea TaxID=109376 RepID=A0A0D3C9V8_BRAOL|nr:PREDICTED: PI-PLC X domain-containing protein At5g67130 [Brassica oleracea var. oleracea]
MAFFRFFFAVTTLVLLHLASIAFASSHGSKQLGDQCSSDEECSVGLGCFKCGIDAARCVRSNITDQFSLVNNSMPFNKYAFLTTHNSYAIEGKPLHVATQEDSITEQLNSGVRALMLDTYDYEGDVWLCHSFHEQCFEFTKFNRAIDTFEEVFAFLTANPSEIVTIFLEDYVKSPNALTKVFTDSGLKKFWFPVEDMPKGGQDWPLVKDMVANNHRLVVFTSDKSKQETEGIAYQWNYVLENQYGDDGVKPSECSNRGESAQLTDKTKALVLINHFSTIPVKLMSCEENSQHLIDTIKTCYVAAGDRWANFVAVDFYKRSSGGGTFQAVDKLNGELLCGRDDVHDCHH